MKNTEEIKIVTAKFRIFRRSTNTNAFGLREFYFMAQDGTVVGAVGNSLHDHAIGDYLTVTFKENEGVLMGFTNAGYEIPELKQRVPHGVTDIIFKRAPKTWMI